MIVIWRGKMLLDFRRLTAGPASYRGLMNQGSASACFVQSDYAIFDFSRRRTEAFPAEAFTPELIAQEGHRVKELY